MKAIVYTQYGTPDVLGLKEVEKPWPKDHEVLVKIKATAVNSGDVRLRKADPFAVRLFFGLTKPRINILGGVFSGVIEQVGSNVKRFKVGDPVFGSTDMKFGAYAEYLCISENNPIAVKPFNVSHSEAAVIPFGATTALHFIKKANIQKGQRVLVNGASGAVGTAAVQLAKYYGAHVTAMCSASNRDLVASIGADSVMDYAKDDLSKMIESFDVVIDTVNKLPVNNALSVVVKKGTLILSAAMSKEMMQGLFANICSSKKVIFGVIKQTSEDMVFLKSLVEAGKLKAVIDKTYTLEQIPAAHVYAETGHKKGNLAVEIS